MAVRLNVAAGIPRFSSELFESFGIRHAFFTRVGGVSKGVFESFNFAVGIGNRRDDPETVLQNYRIAASCFGLTEADVCRGYQDHTVNVERVGEAERGVGTTLPPFDHGVDGLVTTEKDLLLSVRTADCVPVLMCDGAKTVCAAVHAGWRGTVGGITVNALREMEKLGVPARDVLVAIGPCIGKCCYEVGREVYDAFVARDAALEACFVPKDGKFMLDLTAANRMILISAGVPEANVDAADTCTKCNPELFFSHRRSGRDRGTMSAFICLGD